MRLRKLKDNSALPLASLIAVALIAASASAQTRPSQKPSPPTDETPTFSTEVVVTPERGESRRDTIPAATVVIDRASLDAAPVVHPSEIVGLLPGFTAMQAESHAGRPVLSARGFFGGGEAEYTTVLLDGVRMADAESGLLEWSLIPMSIIARVDAVRGPAAASYGDAAVGGVIQFLTDRRSDRGTLSLMGGTFGSFIADGAFGRHSGATALTISGAARRTSGAFQHSGANEIIGRVSIERTIKGALLTWMGTAATRRRDDPGSLSASLLQSDPRASLNFFRLDANDRTDVLSTIVIRQGAAAWRPQAQVFLSARNEDSIRTILLIPDVASTLGRKLAAARVGGSVEVQHDLPIARPGMIHFGGDLARDDLDTHYHQVDADAVFGREVSAAVGNRIRFGAFLLGSVQAGSRVSLHGGVRWDTMMDHGFDAGTTPPSKTAWSPRAGITVGLGPAGRTRLFANLSRAFKAPTLDQSFDRRPYPDFRGGTLTISNRQLLPQLSTNVETGVSGTGPLRWSVLAYDTRVDAEIDFDLRAFSYANIGRSHHRGYEAEVAASWWKRLQPSMSYVFASVEDVDAASDLQLKNVPRHQISVAALSELPGRIVATARYTRSWGAFIDDDNRFAVDGPSRLDVRVRRTIGKHALFVDVVNATDDTFEEYGYTLTDLHGEVVPYAYAGAKRAIRAGFTLAF